MNPSTTALTLNMQLPNIATVSWAVQGDQLSRVITATLLDGATAWNPQAGYHGVVRYHKPDGTSGLYDVDEDGNTAVTWTGNVATIKIVQQALTVAGSVIMQLEFYDSNEARITAFGWTNNVQPSAVTDTEFLSTDYYNILSLQIAGVLGASGHPPYINSSTKNWMLWDEETAAYVDSGYSSEGLTGPAPSVTNTAYQYANSSSGTTVPTSWSNTRPATSPGTWAWTKTTLTFDNSSTAVIYTTAYQGQDGTGSPGSSTPLGGASAGVVGTANAYSREDHQHPFQTAAQTPTSDSSNVQAKLDAIGNVVDLVYPVGSIYMSTSSTSPATLFSGTTWTQLKDRFLLAAGDSYSAGGTGGAASVVLDTTQLPAHTHGSYAMSGDIRLRGLSNGSALGDLNAGSGGMTSSETGASIGCVNVGTGSNQNSTVIHITGTHEHASVGNGQAHNNMPPYLAVYMWERTA